MSQHELRTVTRGAIIAELACLSEQVADVHTSIITVAARHGQILSRISSLQHMLAAAVAMPDATDPVRALAAQVEKSRTKSCAANQAPQAATPAQDPPVAQDRGQPVGVGKALDEVPERGADGPTRAGQSDESVTTSEAGEAAATADDPAPASDATAAPPEKPRERSRYDLVLDRYAATGDFPGEIAKTLDLPKGTAGGSISIARKAGDPRVRHGDKKRADRIGPLPEPTASSPAPVAVAKVELPPPAPAVIPAAPPVAAAARVGNIRIPDGLLISVKSADGEVHGPGGIWRTTQTMAKAAGALSDGQLYGLDRIARLAGIPKEKNFVDLIPVMQSGLAKIGVDLVYTKGIGCMLRVPTMGAR